MSTRHGEYKVPGGKLVVVDLQEHDGRLAAQQRGHHQRQPAQHIVQHVRNLPAR